MGGRMKEKFTYREINDANQAIGQLGQITVGQKTAYRLSRIMEKVRSAGRQVGKDQLEIYKQLGYRNPAAQGGWAVKPENMEAFIKAMDDLMDNKTIEIEYMPVACNMFAQLPAEAILGMGKLMVEEEKIIAP